MPVDARLIAAAFADRTVLEGNLGATPDCPAPPRDPGWQAPTPGIGLTGDRGYCPTRWVLVPPESRPANAAQPVSAVPPPPSQEAETPEDEPKLSPELRAFLVLTNSCRDGAALLERLRTPDLQALLPRMEVLALERRYKLRGPQVVAFAETLAASCPRLAVLAMSSCRVDGPAALALSKLSQLRGMQLENCQVDDEATQHLGTMVSLAGLSLRSNNIDSAAVRHLGTLTNLQALDLTDNYIDDAGLAALSSLRGLGTLLLSTNRLTGAAIAPLAALPRLQGLDLSANPLVRIADLSSAPALRQLDLSETRLPVSELPVLSRLPQLLQLNLSSVNLGDAGAALQGLPAIQWLNVERCRLTDLGAKSLAQLRTLRCLQADRNRIGDTGAMALVSLPDLEILTLAAVPLTHFCRRWLRELEKPKVMLNYMGMRREQLAEEFPEGIPAGLEANDAD